MLEKIKFRFKYVGIRVWKKNKHLTQHSLINWFIRVSWINQTNHSWIAHKICLGPTGSTPQRVDRWTKWTGSKESTLVSELIQMNRFSRKKRFVNCYYHWLYNQYSSKINATTRHQAQRVSALAGRSCRYVPLGGRGWKGCVVMVECGRRAVPAAEADTTAELSLDLRRTTHFAFHTTLLSQRSSLSLLRPST